MSNSKLVTYTKILPYKNSPRNRPISVITIHHMAGNCTAENCLKSFLNPLRKTQGSCNYAVDNNGVVALGVDEADRSWCSNSPENDNKAITIEVANDGGAPSWHVSDVAINKVIELCVDICKRNNIPRLNYTGDNTGNLTRHNMFTATTCPGPYLQSKFPYIADQVNKQLGAKPDIKLSEFRVKILDNALNIRTDAGIKNPIKAVIKDHGVYTIVETKSIDNNAWGKLKSCVGWISLNKKYVQLL